ncbi:MAG TPA: threonine synthase [Saprospiraceae bacterium]|nr:threonine synthase [Saprospiraceae bacterium]
MPLYSTQNKNNIVDLRRAVMHSLPEDRGLYMPLEIPSFDLSHWKNLKGLTFKELSFHVAKVLIGNEISDRVLEQIVYDTVNFPAPVVMLDESIGALELFHGPSQAFKDFGARFMSRLMSYFNKDSNQKITILVATSGDTGGAVAAGFHKIEGVEVIILFPSGKVSHLQEKQLTTYGDNIIACEIEGTFDDCQALVKHAFLDGDLKKKYSLSSANSINIARLIPQTFYYFEMWKQLPEDSKELIVSVPSGNFGNLTAALFSRKMGLPVSKFVAATNINKVIPDYLRTGLFCPHPSFSTISNAMDVGNPSNFVRILDLYENKWERVIKDVEGYYCNDAETEESMKEAFDKYGYILDPHGAIGYRSLVKRSGTKEDYRSIFLETAHPGKFLPTVERVLQKTIPIPEKLKQFEQKVKNSELFNSQFETFKEYLLSRDH